MVDWKKIRDEYEAAKGQEIADPKNVFNFNARLQIESKHFPSLISALEDQEKALERAQKECESYQRTAESARQSHTVAELTANERKKRIEFLEKALEQAVEAASIERGATSISVSVDVPKSFVSDGSGSIENLLPAEGFPELAKYLEEKNG